MNNKFFTDIVLRVKLTIRLLKDSRVPFYLKLLPALCVVYLIIPADLLVGPIDDALVLYLGMEFFIDFCPREVVAEHLRDLRERSAAAPSPSETPKEEDVIDAEFKEK
jgi:uncharacterized membrane protein YkvA (DUF1232 family)